MAEKKVFTPEYKRGNIKLTTERGKKVSEVAKDIGIFLYSQGPLTCKGPWDAKLQFRII